jgi:hypothetical protein
MSVGPEKLPPMHRDEMHVAVDVAGTASAVGAPSVRHKVSQCLIRVARDVSMLPEGDEAFRVESKTDHWATRSVGTQRRARPERPRPRGHKHGKVVALVQPQLDELFHTRAVDHRRRHTNQTPPKAAVVLGDLDHRTCMTRHWSRNLKMVKLQLARSVIVRSSVSPAV